MAEKTYWNGEETPCRRVIVKVGTGDPLGLYRWYRGLEGTERRAVEVSYAGQTFLIDDDEGEGDPLQHPILAQLPRGLQTSFKAGDGWRKVTIGRGAPFGLHASFRSLPPDSVVIREVTE